MESTLVLNASFEPLEIVSAKRAIALITLGKASSVDNSPKFMRSEHVAFPIPYVIQLSYMVHRPYGKKVAFSRRGVFIRDNFSCVYCSKKATTIDHVVPASKGGQWSYDNCVAACIKCNNKKSNYSLKKMGWTIPFELKEPSPYKVMLHNAKQNSEAYKSWHQFIEPWVR